MYPSGLLSSSVFLPHPSDLLQNANQVSPMPSQFRNGFPIEAQSCWPSRLCGVQLQPMASFQVHEQSFLLPWGHAMYSLGAENFLTQRTSAQSHLLVAFPDPQTEPDPDHMLSKHRMPLSFTRQNTCLIMYPSSHLYG